MSTVDVDLVERLLARYKFDPTTEWSEADQAALDTCLQVADHFDDNDVPHDPVFCQLDLPRSTDGRDHQERTERKLIRQSAGLTQRQLAARVENGKESISRYESNLRKPVDAGVYLEFLRTQSEQLAADARTKVWMLARKRDGWWKHSGEPWTRDAGLAHWQVMFKSGGLFDRWRDTGTLPEWTPADAGCAAG